MNSPAHTERNLRHWINPMFLSRILCYGTTIQTMIMLIILALPYHANTAAAQTISLVENGQPKATIVIPVHRDKWTDLAAEWLQDYVTRATGATLPIVTEGQPSSGAIISIGHTDLSKRADITEEDWKWDTAKIVVRENVLFLIGRDDNTNAPTPSIPNATGEALHQAKSREIPGAHGTCKAVTTFLEEVCGVRWFLPVPEGEYVPKTNTLAVPSDLDRTIVPQFAYSEGRYLYGNGTPASFANNFRTAIKMRTYGGHSYYGWLPADVYFKDHPEYFALVGGKRIAEGNHLCSSNPEVRKILIREIRKDFDAGHDWVQLGQEDNYTRCQCDNCEALDRYRDEMPPDWYEMYDQSGFERLKKAPCERLLLLHKAIVDACLESHPDKTVKLLVYRQTLVPSELFDSFGSNVVGEMCNINPRAILPWDGKVRAYTCYLYWFDITLGLGMGLHTTPRQAAERIRYLRDWNFIGIFQIPETNWGLMGPVYWTIAKTMGDADLDPDALVEEYCRGVFEDAAAPMSRFFNTLYKRDIVAIERSSAAEQHLFYYPPTLCNQLEQILQEAEAAATTERAQKWVQLTREHFDYLKYMSFLLTAYQAYEANPTQDNRAEFLASRETFKYYRKHVLDLDMDYVSQWFPGYQQFAKFLGANGRNVYYTSFDNWREISKQDSGEIKEIGFPGPGVIREPFGEIP